MSEPRDRSAHVEPDASGIDVSSGVGASSGFGFVSLRWGSEAGQLTTREAREHALGILAAADAAEFDAAIVHFLTHTAGLEMPAAVVMLGEIRIARAVLAAAEAAEE